MIKVKNLIKNFVNDNIETKVLKGIDLEVKSGEFISIVGRSGSGKSTFLYQMSLLDEPTSGEIFIDDIDVSRMTGQEKTNFRLNRLGYVFQDYALLPEMTALENVALPLLMKNIPEAESYKIARNALERVGLGNLTNHLPSQLSGGEQQRVSVSRAIAHNPKILFADEPTANLDNESSKKIMDIFKELHGMGQTIVMITHEMEYANMTERIIRLDDGKIV